jgi:hypothetical protein
VIDPSLSLAVSPELLNRVDELVRADLQDLRDSYFQWLLIATGAVFIGVIMEGPEVVRDLLEGFRTSRNSDVTITNSHHPMWVLLLSSIGWVLISGGVIGEGIFEALVSKADGVVQTFNNILLADTQRQTSEANVRMGSAELAAASSRMVAAEAAARAENSNARAKHAESQIAAAQRASDEASQKAEMFRLDIAKANERATTNETESARLRKQAEDEKLEREKLEVLVSPRRIGSDDQLRIRTVLGRFGIRTVRVSSNGLARRGSRSPRRTDYRFSAAYFHCHGRTSSSYFLWWFRLWYPRARPRK